MVAFSNQIVLFFFAGNTISNWVFLIPPAFGAYLSFKNGLEHRYTLSFIALCGGYFMQCIWYAAYRIFSIDGKNVAEDSIFLFTI